MAFILSFAVTLLLIREVDVQESMLESASVIATLRKTCNNSSYSCIDRCNGTSEEKSPTCSCESNCQDLGTCCADYLFSSCVDIPLVSNVTGSEQIEPLREKKHRQQEFCRGWVTGETDSIGVTTVLVIASCSQNYSEQVMKSRCEIDPLLNPGQRHVTVSGKTYLNYACALCNQEDLTGSNVIYWPLEMVCSSFINKTADGEWSYEQVIDFVFNTAVKDGTCYSNVFPPSRVSDSFCQVDLCPSNAAPNVCPFYADEVITISGHSFKNLDCLGCSSNFPNLQYIEGGCPNSEQLVRLRILKGVKGLGEERHTVTMSANYDIELIQRFQQFLPEEQSLIANFRHCQKNEIFDLMEGKCIDVGPLHVDLCAKISTNYRDCQDQRQKYSDILLTCLNGTEIYCTSMMNSFFEGYVIHQYPLIVVAALSILSILVVISIYFKRRRLFLKPVAQVYLTQCILILIGQVSLLSLPLTLEQAEQRSCRLLGNVTLVIWLGVFTSQVAASLVDMWYFIRRQYCVNHQEHVIAIVHIAIFVIPVVMVVGLAACYSQIIGSSDLDDVMQYFFNEKNGCLPPDRTLNSALLYPLLIATLLTYLINLLIVLAINKQTHLSRTFRRFPSSKVIFTAQCFLCIFGPLVWLSAYIARNFYTKDLWYFHITMNGSLGVSQLIVFVKGLFFCRGGGTLSRTCSQRHHTMLSVITHTRQGESPRSALRLHYSEEKETKSEISKTDSIGT